MGERVYTVSFAGMNEDVMVRMRDAACIYESPHESGMEGGRIPPTLLHRYLLQISARRWVANLLRVSRKL